MTTVKEIYYPQTKQQIEQVLSYLGKKMPDCEGHTPADSYAFTILDEDNVVGIVQYRNFSKHECTVNLYTSSPLWCNRRVLKNIFWYPFGYLKNHRLSAIVRSSNTKMNSIMQRLGFRMEGVLKECFIEEDGILWAMLRSECKWLGEANG